MLAWIDLEMTGLEPDRHVIVEIASLLTDDDLNIIAEGPDLVIHADERQLAEMDDFVTAMHARSGLTDMIRQIDALMITVEPGCSIAYIKELSLMTPYHYLVTLESETHWTHIL